jgi:hypothetical protein
MFQYRIQLRQIAMLVTALVTMLIASPALAQTTGSLRGEVVDEDMGLPIPNVEVTLEGANLIGGTQTRNTDDNGGFHFVELLPGAEYHLTVSKAGFKTVSVSKIAIMVNRETVQNVEMPTGKDAEEVEIVSARKAVDTESTTRGEVLSKEFLQRIPAGRSYQQAVGAAAGVLGGSNPNMAGGAYNENTYMLDGANITDPVTGTFSTNFNFDAIQQVEVMLGGYMPEYGVSLGGVVNIVTESGTNNLEFDSSVFYTTGDLRPKMDARYASDGFQLGPTGFDATFGVSRINTKISGPVVRDRAWFVISFSAVRSVIANTGVRQARDFDAQYVLGKLTFQPSSEHRFSMFLQMDPTVIDNSVQGLFIKNEAQGRQVQGGYVTNAQWQWFLSPEANIDTRVVIQKTFIESGPTGCTHNRDVEHHPCRPWEQEGEVDWETPGRVGLFGAYDSVNYGFYYFDDRIRYQASSKLSVVQVEDPLGGTHDFKFGVEANQTVWDQIQGYSGNTLWYDINELGFDPESLINYYHFEITGPIKFRTSGSTWSWFAQDAWKPVSNLTVRYGTRFDNSVMRNDLGEPSVTGTMWGPRFYAAWDPFGDQKTKVGGGYGRFNDTGRLAVADYTSASSFGSKLYVGELFADGQGQGFLNSASNMASYSPIENTNIAHDKLRMPRVDEVLLQFQREVITDVAVGVDLTGKFTRSLYEPDQLNLIYDEDGSSIIGSRQADSQVSYGRLRTPELAKRDYFQADFKALKVNSRRWFGQIVYTYSTSIGSSAGALSGSFMNDPQTQYNYGRIGASDIRHVVKSYGSWNLPTDPWDQFINFYFEYFSGSPLERLYYSEENFGYNLRIRDRGVYHRFNPYWSMTVSFMQDFDVRKGTLRLQAAFENVFNNRAPANFSSSFYSEHRLLTTNRQDPLEMEFGIRYFF